MELTGKVKMIGTEVSVSEKFRKRDLVITDDSNSQYPQHISMQCTQDKCSLLDNINVGDTVKVQINIRGREWVSPQGEVKYFNTIETWKIEVVSSSKQLSNPITDAPAPSYEQQVAPGTKYPNTLPEGYISPVANTVVNDELPF